VKVLNIKETRKTRGGFISRGGGGAYNRMYFFCLQVDGPITGGAYKRGGGAYKRQFTVCRRNTCAFENWFVIIYHKISLISPLPAFLVICPPV